MTVSRYRLPGQHVVWAPEAHQYVGVSGDTKPTGASVPPGSTFIERNTGKTFIWDGTAWGQIIFPTTVA
jgi:hypothetical protein